MSSKGNRTAHPTAPVVVNTIYQPTFKTSALALAISGVSSVGLPAHAAESWPYTYNTNGQVLTADGPRTDVTDVTTNTYDAAGNLATITVQNFFVSDAYAVDLFRFENGRDWDLDTIKSQAGQ